jgi:hypothetical protein
MKEDEIGRTCDTHGGEETWLRGFGGGRETAWVTRHKLEDNKFVCNGIKHNGISKMKHQSVFCLSV